MQRREDALCGLRQGGREGCSPSPSHRWHLGRTGFPSTTGSLLPERRPPPPHPRGTRCLSPPSLPGTWLQRLGRPLPSPLPPGLRVWLSSPLRYSKDQEPTPPTPKPLRACPPPTHRGLVWMPVFEGMQSPGMSLGPPRGRDRAVPRPGIS